MNKRILHVARCDKFIPSYIDLVNKEFGKQNHKFLLKSGMADHCLVLSKNVFLEDKYKNNRYAYYFKLIKEMHRADKLIFHNLIDIKIIQILFLSPWLLKKSYWVVWGSDLYSGQYEVKNWKWKIKEHLRKRVFGNVRYLITYLSGDVKLARKWYGAKGEYLECLMYKSNIYKEYNLESVEKSVINIQIGNSADSSNNHIEVLEKLLPFKNENINIYVPLSYGSKAYAERVVEVGREYFGDKFHPLFDFMPLNEYRIFLGSIDIAIFNHKRQQAMGNTITLLGLGKTVYLQRNTSQWFLFKEKGIKVYDINKFDSLVCQNHIENIKLVKKYFSMENFKIQLSKIFEI